MNEDVGNAFGAAAALTCLGVGFAASLAPLVLFGLVIDDEYTIG